MSRASARRTRLLRGSAPRPCPAAPVALEKANQAVMLANTYAKRFRERHRRYRTRVAALHVRRGACGSRAGRRGARSISTNDSAAGATRRILVAMSRASRMLVGLARAVRTQERADARVHFHSGDHGRPYVCENPRCESPSLDPAEAEWWEITRLLLAP